MRNKILMQLLRATGTVELEVKTDFGQVSLTAKRAPNETKTFLVVMGNRVNKTVYSQHEDLTYEQAQENSLAQAVNAINRYRLPNVEVVYGKLSI